MTAIFYLWWFEPALASACFAFFINWYWYYERNVYLVSAVTSFQSTVYWDVKNGPLLQSFLSYWIGIYLWTRVVPPAANHIPDGIPRNLSDCCELLLQVVLGIVYYDAIFFFLHWMMHEIPILRRFHARHHDYHVIQRSTNGSVLPDNTANRTDCTNKTGPTQKEKAPIMMECRQTLCHSVVDGALQVLVNILVQRKLWIPRFRQSPPSHHLLSQKGRMFVIALVVKSRLARALHNIIIIWMLTESHSAAPRPYLWRRYFIGCREHYLHHTIHLASLSSNCHILQQPEHKRIRYQQFFGYLDNLRFAILDRSIASYSINVKQKST